MMKLPAAFAACAASWLRCSRRYALFSLAAAPATICPTTSVLLKRAYAELQLRCIFADMPLFARPPRQLPRRQLTAPAQIAD